MEFTHKIQGRFAELQTISNYTFLRGASHPQELVAQAARLGYAAIAITDECSLSGIVKAHVAAEEHNIKLIVGSEFLVVDPEYEDNNIKVVILVRTKLGYHQLSSLITLARRRSEKGSYYLKLSDLEHTLTECIVIWIPFHTTLINFKQGEQLKRIFDERLYMGFTILENDDQQTRYFDDLHLSEQLLIPMLACNDVHMHIRDRKPLLDILHATRENSSVQKIAGKLTQNAEQHLRTIKQLQQLYPMALLETAFAVAEQCQFKLTEICYEYPPELIPPAMTPDMYLRMLCEQGVKVRWPNGIPEQFSKLLEKELALIKEMRYEYYFLTVQDIVAYAKSKNIYCQGRGSAANSIVCYCLFITEIGPDKIDMLFERFISKERDEPPDIDVDFEHQRREEVIQYIYKKYSRERAAIVASIVTYKPKSAIRDVGKALGMSEALIESLSQSLSWWDRKKELLQRIEEKNLQYNNRIIDCFMENVQLLLGFPRHLSQHVGGFIITKSPISTLVPVENASMADRTVIQWDKYDIEAMGLLKVDVLALGMLTVIHKAIDLINNYSTKKITLSDIPHDDSKTYDLLCKADTVGLFQVESRAQMSMLPRLKPRKFYDLVIEVAIVRPGPIQGNMVHPFLKRRDKLESVSYPNQDLKEVLEKTLGVPIFQEQVIKIAMIAANFTGGEADQLRRSMASWGRDGHLEIFEKKLIDGMLDNGYSLAFAKQIYEQIKGFSGYGFPESHSASFALLAYFSAWLKCYHPCAFYCALLNSQPVGFYTPSQLLQDAKRHNVEVLPITLLNSDWDSTLTFDNACEVPKLRLGFHLVNHFNKRAAERVVNARAKRNFYSVQDIKKYCQLNETELAALVHANALLHPFGERKQVHWSAQDMSNVNSLLDLKANNQHVDFIKEETPTEKVLADYESTSLCLDIHPVKLLRDYKEFLHCKKADELKALRHRQTVQMLGLVTCRQRPASASGVIFLTLEDETGNTNVIVWASLFKKFRQALMMGKLLLVKGNIEREKSVIHVVAGYIADYSHLLKFKLPSRDFH